MAETFDFFISHSSKDNDRARELKQILLEINSKWNIFLDIDANIPLNKEIEWNQGMLRNVENSRYLIFLASSADYLKNGHGWLFKEVQHFYGKNATRERNQVQANGEKLTIAYFGILFGRKDPYLALSDDLNYGSSYCSMYERIQHVYLDQDDSVRDGFYQIREKVLNMTSQKDIDAPKMLDLVSHYVHERQLKDEKFSMDAVDTMLLPPLLSEEKRAEEEQVIGFEEFCGKLKKTHAAVLGEQGGCGKTTFMTRLFFHHLELAKEAPSDAMIPLFIDARELKGKDNLILRYLADKFCRDHTARSREYTGQQVNWLSQVFGAVTDSPHYLLLIDGCNELPSNAADKFRKELEDFGEDGKYPNARIVLSGRTLDGITNDDAPFLLTHLAPLEDDAVRAYLRKKLNTDPDRLLSAADGEHLRNILKNPMFLRLYTDAPGSEAVDSKSKLIRESVRRQEEKDRAAAEQEPQQAFYSLCLHYILPAAAYKLVMGRHTESRFSFSDEELDDIMEEILDDLSSHAMKKYYGRIYQKLLRTYNPGSTKDCFDLACDFVDYLTKTCKLLRRIDEDRYEFVHQIYRDYFCGCYIEQDILRALEHGVLCRSLIEGGIEQSVGSFVAELLEEPRPFWNWETRSTDYGNEESSRLLALLDLSRSTPEPDAPVHTANVIALLRTARANDLSGIDFSGLDLTRSNLRTSVLARQFADGWRTASFRGAVINPENLLTIQHHCPICAACANESHLATLDTGGVIMIWDRSRPPVMPVKIIENAGYGFFKILFAPDGQSLYGVNDTRILRIPIPTAARGSARTEIVHETNKRFWDISLDENGALYFTTAMNPFNPKPVSDPHRPDRIVPHFNTQNSCAAANRAGTQLVFGFSLSRVSLRLFDYDSASGQWIDRRFRFTTLYNQFTATIEGLLKDAGLYEVFAAPEELPLSPGQKPVLLAELREKHSILLQQRQTVRNFRNYLNSILSTLSQKGIDIPNNWKHIMEERCEEATQRSLRMYKYAGALFGQKGMIMRSVAYSADDSRLLIAYSEPPKSLKTYKKKRFWTHVISEIDTQTMDVFNIACFSTNTMISLDAQYTHGGVLVTTPDQVTIFDTSGATVMQLDCENAEPKYLSRTSLYEDSFYVYSRHFIYQMSHDGTCVMALDNQLRTEKLARIFRKRDTDFLINTSDPSNARHRCINPSSCDLLQINQQMWRSKARMDLSGLSQVCLDDSGYAIRHGKLFGYRRSHLFSQLEIPFCLFVCGCDFTDLKGGLAAPEYLRLLSAYGARTDDYPPNAIPALAQIPAFIPSKIPFTAVTPTARDASCAPERETEQPSIMVESDYSILEWTDRLMAATPEIIFRLLEAGCLVKPAPEGVDLAYISRRMAGYLSRKKLLSAPEDQQETQPGHRRIYTVGCPDGVHTLWRGTEDTLPGATDPCRCHEYDTPGLLKTGNWFSQTARRYAGHAMDFTFYSVFHNKARISGMERIPGYLQLGQQAFFAQPVPNLDSEYICNDFTNKAWRLCQIALGWEDLTYDHRGSLHQLKLSRPPVLIFIGDDLNHCRQIHACICRLFPRLRKLYTYDTLLADEYSGPMHFEFVKGQPYAVDLEDLIPPPPAPDFATAPIE